MRDTFVVSSGLGLVSRDVISFVLFIFEVVRFAHDPISVVSCC